MLKLNRMTESDYKSYIENVIIDYAHENVKAGHWSDDEALQKSKDQTNNLLKNGLDSDGHYLFSVFDNEEDAKIGVLWVYVEKNKRQDKSAFIYDIVVNENFRGKGYGKKTLEILENWCKNEDISSIALHVFAHNSVARNLYLKVGYKDMSYNMKKYIK